MSEYRTPSRPADPRDQRDEFSSAETSTGLLEVEEAAVEGVSGKTQTNSRLLVYPCHQDKVLTVAGLGISMRPAWHREIAAASAAAIRTRWFWYSIAASFCWTAWAFSAKLGSREIPPAGMQFLSTLGFLLVGLVTLIFKYRHLQGTLRAGWYSLLSGLLLAIGGIALYAAYRSESTGSVVTGITSLYPMVTVCLAVVFLKEKLNRKQIVGLGFAVAAILLLSQ
jgi:bacterial/archaeal transporter family protein